MYSYLNYNYMYIHSIKKFTNLSIIFLSTKNGQRTCPFHSVIEEKNSSKVIVFLNDES